MNLLRFIPFIALIFATVSFAQEGAIKVQTPDAGPDAFSKLKRFPALQTKEHRERYHAGICRQIEAAAKAKEIPPAFFARLLWQESRFNANAVSPKGAAGIAQFMPATARERGLDNPFDPVLAIPASADYLRELFDLFGNLGLAAAAYNAGPARVEAWRAGESSLPLETHNFVRIITGLQANDWVAENPPKVEFILREGVSFLQACGEFRIQGPSSGHGAPNGAPWRPWGVHLITHQNRSTALSIYRTIQNEQPALLKGVEPMVLVMRNNSFGWAPRYAVRIGKQTEADAIDLCAKLRRSGGACIVYKTPR